MALCRHCAARNVNRPRGLCWSCYHTPGLRERYPSTSKYARQGVGVGHRVLTPPPCPTEFAPGTLGKVAVLAERARLGTSLWHPLDADGGGERDVVLIAAEFVLSEEHHGPDH